MFSRRRHIHGRLLEIGTFEGRFSTLLARHARSDEEIFLTDNGTFPGFDVMMDAVESIHRRCVFIEDDSAQLPTHFAKLGGEHPNLSHSFRMIHIDGNHETEPLRQDLVFADQCCSSNGIIIVDDYFSPLYPHITDRVNEFVVGNPNVSRILVAPNKAYLCRPEAEGMYRQFLLNDFVSLTRQLGFNFQICLTDAGTKEDASAPIGLRIHPGYGGPVRLADWADAGSNHTRRETAPKRGPILNRGVFSEPPV